MKVLCPMGNWLGNTAHSRCGQALPSFPQTGKYNRSKVLMPLALQLHCPDGSESMGDHDSGFDDWWCVGRRYAEAVGFVVARSQATHASAIYAGAGRDLGGAVFR